MAHAQKNTNELKGLGDCCGDLHNFSAEFEPQRRRDAEKKNGEIQAGIKTGGRGLNGIGSDLRPSAFIPGNFSSLRTCGSAVQNRNGKLRRYLRRRSGASCLTIHFPRRRRGLFVFPFVLALVGCSYVNVPLNDNSVLLENRVKNHTLCETFTQVQPPGLATPNIRATTQPEIYPTPSTSVAQAVSRSDKDGYFVGLAISGGGLRSANFAAACMFQLERIGLLQKVDYISSVSGGSLTAAYYCLNKNGWNPKEVQEKLTHEFASDMLLQTLLPWNLFAMTFTDLDRSDLLAKTLRENLFTQKGHEQTFGDLLPDRPRLLINATDLQSGRRFVFCNQSFDEINTSLAKYPISYAVSASSSVPVVLHQVTLRDFSTEYKQYRHLIDGGVADNLGIETLVETFRAQEQGAIDHHLPDPYPNGAVFIVLDARVEYDQDLSSRSDTSFIESLATAAGLTSATLLNRASEETLNDVVFKNAPDTSTAKEIRDALGDLNRDGFVDFKNVGGHRIRVAHIALTQLKGVTDVPFHSFQDYINGTSTYFNIDMRRAALLYTAADLLIRDRFESRLKEIVNELNR
jgi:predicted acylesterase/phospholipase RssA